MKILFFTDWLGCGGKERRIGELVKGLVLKNEYEIEIISMNANVHYTIFAELKIPINFLIRKVRWDPSIFAELFKICKIFKPDIIHTWDHMTSFYAFPVAKLLGIKFINGMITTAPPKLSFLNKNKIIRKISIPFSDVILSNSKAGLRSFNAPTGKSHYIYNGFDFNRLAKLRSKDELREDLGLQDYKIIGMVAGFTSHKDYKTFIAAAKILLEHRDDICFLAVGDGPYFEDCKNIVTTSRITRFKFLGRIHDTESIINTFDIGILLTNSKLVGEGISNSIMEYMALGKPVIATNSGGTNEIVINNDTGFLITDNKVEVVVEKIEYLLNNPEISRSMGYRGRERIKKYFSIEKMIQEFINLYQGK